MRTASLKASFTLIAAFSKFLSKGAFMGPRTPYYNTGFIIPNNMKIFSFVESMPY